MSTEPSEKRGRIYLGILTCVFMLAEIIFSIQVLEVGNGDLTGSSLKTLLFLVFIFLVYKGFNWARWILAVLLILLSIGCLLAWLENGGIAFLLITSLYLVFGVELLRSKRLINLTKKEIQQTDVDDRVKVSSDRAFVKDAKEFKYPLLLTRYKALFIDGMLLLTVMILVMIWTSEMDSQPTIMISIGIIIGFYEPILTSHSATIGQRLMKIRVRDYTDPEKKINFWRCYVRYFIKGLLGWLSFITINLNPEHRAIHDYAGSSVVIKVE